jgi:hypothetical protein
MTDAVLGIVTSLFSRVATASSNDETTDIRLVELIAGQVYARLLPQAWEIALDISRSCHAEITALVAPPEPPSRQKRHLAEARGAREQRQIKRNALGAELSRLRLEAAERVLSEPVEPEPLTPLLDQDTPTEEFECSETTEATYEQHRLELEKPFEISWHCRNRRRYAEFPLSRKLAFLLACHSRPALDIARQFIPLPSYETVQHPYQIELRNIERGLSDLSLLKQQIRLSMEGTELPPGSFVSIAVDAMAMNPDGSNLSANHSDNEFVIYVQPLDRRYSCWPLHVMGHPSGRATEEVLDAMETCRNALAEHGLHVKFECSDGDTGHNQSHRDFFKDWYPLFVEKGLKGAIEYAAGRDNRFPPMTFSTF